MKTQILIYSIISFFILSCGDDEAPTKKSETIPVITETSSNCSDSTNQLKVLFEKKASLLALKYTLEKNTSFVDSTQIDEGLKDKILSVFYAIKQAKNLKNKDLVLDINIYPYPSISTINLFLDKNSTLASSWKDNHSTTANDTINQLLKDFDFTVSTYNESHAKGHKVTLTSTKMWNTQAVLNKFLKVKGVAGNNEEITSIIDDIHYIKEENFQQLDFIDRELGIQKMYSYQVDENCVVKVLE